MKVDAVLSFLKENASEENRLGMSRFGIQTENAFGISIAVLRPLAKKIGRNQKLASALWESGYHESRLLATMVAEPMQMNLAETEEWVSELNSWDLCDQLCFNLIRKQPFAFSVVYKWAASEKEFTRRTAFSLIAGLVISEKKRSDKDFFVFFPLIKQYAHDERNMVKKAVNWALRQLGKRSKTLYVEAKKIAAELSKSESASARWIAKDALREFEKPQILNRIKG